jgi:hypothetical protein
VTQDQFTAFAAASVRHLLTLGAGLLVARGFTAGGDMVSNLAAAVAVFAATLAWSFIQKHKLLSALVAGLDVSALEQLLAQAAELKRQGADPLLVAHMTGTALAVAQSELATIKPTSSTSSPVVADQTAAVVEVPAPAPPVPPVSGVQEPDVLPEGATL